MKLVKALALWTLCFAVAFAFSEKDAIAKTETKGMPLRIVSTWSGDYPVTKLGRLPEGQRHSRFGCLTTPARFDAVWQVFKPGEKVPAVDFSRHLAVFSRNQVYYNRLSIAAVLLKGETAEILTRETMSALPIEDTVAMALAVIPRAGVTFIGTSEERVRVPPVPVSAENPLNASYLMEGIRIHLKNGRAEQAAATGSAIRAKTRVLGKPITGDLDGDGDPDAAVVLIHDPGGSGTFYYLAAAIQKEGRFQGTNVVLLGDRIAHPDITLRHGVITARWKHHGPGQAMSDAPAVETTRHLVFDKGALVLMKPFVGEEHLRSGWITIGHEVRSFQSCCHPVEQWISGSSPALETIIRRYRAALPDAGPYRPVFMILVGKDAPVPQDGFGADYDAAFVASRFVHIRHKGNCQDDTIIIDSPLPGAKIPSPVTIRGRARGIWFFEGDFPMVLKDRNGRALARGLATAQGESMTMAFVPFEGTLTYDVAGEKDRAFLVFKRHNPTDLAEHDMETEVPVVLAGKEGD